MRATLFSILAPLLAATPAFSSGYLQGSPENQRACYRLDHSPQRTSAMIRDGQGEIIVKAANRQADGSSAYEVDFVYRLRVFLTNSTVGTIKIKVPADYFTSGFYPRLRSTRSYASQGFKIEWLGSENVTTLDHQTFNNTDRGHVFDIDTSGSESMGPQEEAMITDLQLWIDATPDIPGIGAARIDVKGKMFNADFQTGIDYTTDVSQCPN